MLYSDCFLTLLWNTLTGIGIEWNISAPGLCWWY